jgi:hypothetical protein
MCRVLRDDGQLLFLEHNRADDTRTARLQARLNRVWMPCSGGCHLDRDAPTLIESAGFTIERLERSQLTTFAGPFAGLAPVFGTIRSGVAHRSPV